jgi:hypothetical protein
MLVLGTGCGRAATDDAPGGAPPLRVTTSRQGDIELLQAAHAMELAELAVAEGAHAGIERAHAERLAQALRDLGAEPGPGPSGGTLAPDDPQVAESVVIAFYLDMLPKVYDAELRKLVASILVVEGQQLAAARSRAGSEPAPDAFVYGELR